MRVLIDKDPFLEWATDAWHVGEWPARWIVDPRAALGVPLVMAFRRSFTLSKASSVRLHVTADERYELFLDGERLGRGPERGSPLHWFFETCDLNLAPGEHLLVARVWWLGGDNDLSPHAQMTVRPGFLAAAEGLPKELVNTGVAAWESKLLGGYEWLDPNPCWGAGARVRIKGSEYDWGLERGEGDGWQPAAAIWPGKAQSVESGAPPAWRLRPSLLPAMLERPLSVGRARHVQEVASEDTAGLPVRAAEHLPDEAQNWDGLLSGESSLAVPPHTRRRIIVDLEDYYCAWPEVVVSGGHGSILRLRWAEALFEDAGHSEKGNRDEIEGRLFFGVGDVFEPDGGTGRLFSTLWWAAGRYLEIIVTTAEEPLTIERLGLRETHYPYQFSGRFEASDPKLAGVAIPAKRVLEMCSHETYMDCPYYEQMMYIGDTRLEVLTTYALTNDDRLPRKALLMFDVSRDSEGLTRSRYPARWSQTIGPFSLWWVAMLHDYACWRDDPDFVAERMPGVRAVLEACRRYVNQDGLLGTLPGWNFMDWVPAWKRGVPPDGAGGISGVINWQYVLVLRLAAELEEMVGEPLLAERNRQAADRAAAPTIEAFWDDRRGLLADDLGHRHFSEHAQCLAILAEETLESPVLSATAGREGPCLGPERRSRLADGLLNEPDLARTTIYFTHYLFEALRVLGRTDRLLERMRLWFDLPARGFRTTPEAPEPSRSDCHAWGAHPLFHYPATLLGIRPSLVGFRTVRITPQLGPLDWARTVLPHPRGEISVELRRQGDGLTGEIRLPEGIGGELICDGRHQEIGPGLSQIGDGGQDV